MRKKRFFKIIKLFIWEGWMGWACLSQAQIYKISGVVRDQEKNEPLPFVNILVNKQTHKGTYTNIEGKFTVESEEPIWQLDFYCIGYESVTIVPVNAHYYEVSMKPGMILLQEYVVHSSEDPAVAIIREVIKNRDRNNPEKNTAFVLTSYNKFIVTIQDSLLQLPDTVLADTSVQRLREFLRDRDLFITETVTEKQHVPPATSKEQVLAAKTSGFPNTMFAWVSGQLQSFSIYHDFFSLLGDNYVSPISAGSWNKYVFLLRDTMIETLHDTVWIIQFFPRKGKFFEALKGWLYVHQSNYAVIRFICEPAYPAPDKPYISIKQEYQFLENRYYFPSQLYSKIYFNNIRVNNITPVGISWTYFTRIKCLPALKITNPHIEMEIQPDALQQEALLDSLRYDALSEREIKTYHFIDSISQSIGLEEKVNRFQWLMTGVYPFRGGIGIPLQRLVYYNEYEGMRLGLGIQTLPSLSEKFMANIYGGYGLKDTKWKYGGEVAYTISWKKQAKMAFFYRREVTENGYSSVSQNSSSSSFWNTSEFYRDFQASNFDYERQWGVRWMQRAFSSLQLTMEASKNDRESGYVMYKYSDEGLRNWWHNFFEYYRMQMRIRWQWRERFIQTPIGYFSKGSSFPECIFSVSAHYFAASWRPMYYVYQMQISHKVKWKYWGHTHGRVAAGMLQGEVPDMFKFSPAYNGSHRVSVYSEYAMETVKANEYIADRFVYLGFHHHFEGTLWNTRKVPFSPAIVLNAYLGDLSNSLYHSFLAYRVPRQGIAEAGLLIENILKASFSSLGIGTFMRLYPSVSPQWYDNIWFKIYLTMRW